MAMNITVATFRGRRDVVTAPLWQYDYGQMLVFDDLELPEAFEVHFGAAMHSGTTITQIGSDNAVTIPDAFLLSGKNVYAWIFLHEEETDGETEYMITMPVNKRPEPKDDIPEPVEQSAIDQAIAALQRAVTQTAADVISADASATAASQSATDAQTAATQAQGSATSASASASTASTAAATATQKASEAATSAANAASAKTAAETAEANAKAAQTASESAKASAESAVQTATSKAAEASTSATSASGSASAASASASAASESATLASQSATAASGSATSAATSASTASTKASEASASATSAQTAQTAAEAAQTAAEEVLESIPSDYSDLSDAVSILEPAATSADVGKTLVVKTVENGKTSEYVFKKAGNLTNNIRNAMLACFQKVAWVDQTGTYFYNALYDALYEVQGITLNKYNIEINELDDTYQLSATTDPEEAAVFWSSSDTMVAEVDQTGLVTAKGFGVATITASAGEHTAECIVTVSVVTVESITAVYNQTNTVYELSYLDACKSDLTVTAHLSNGQSEVVPSENYSLSGSLVAGTSTITVTYADKTDAITVNVTALTGHDYIKLTDSATLAAGFGIMTKTSFQIGDILETSLYYTNATYTGVQKVIGQRNGGSGRKLLGLFVTPSTGRLSYWYVNTDSSQDIRPLSANQRSVIKVKPVGLSTTYPNNATFDIDGTDYDTGSTATSEISLSWLGFFQYAISDTSFGPVASTDRNFGLRIGRTTVKDINENIVNDYIPANDGTHSGLFDPVENAFYYNETYYEKYECGDYE